MYNGVSITFAPQITISIPTIVDVLMAKYGSYSNEVEEIDPSNVKQGHCWQSIIDNKYEINSSEVKRIVSKRILLDVSISIF